MKPCERLNTLDRALIIAALDRHAPARKGSECVEWMGPISQKGYGIVCIKGTRYSAHRASWVAENGPIAPKLLACHHCDNRPCVNFDHIFIGTNQDNMVDATQKRRIHYFISPQTMPRGERHGMSKLTHDKVQIIRASPKTGVALAREFGVSPRTISGVRRGQWWA